MMTQTQLSNWENQQSSIYNLVIWEQIPGQKNCFIRLKFRFVLSKKNGAPH